MSLPRSDSTESILSVLTCASEEYQSFYGNEGRLTKALSDDALLNIIIPNSARLRAADKRHRFDDLLSTMLKHAPHPSGERYIAICLHIAQQRGEEQRAAHKSGAATFIIFSNAAKFKGKQTRSYCMAQGEAIEKKTI